MFDLHLNPRIRNASNVRNIAGVISTVHSLYASCAAMIASLAWSCNLYVQLVLYHRVFNSLHVTKALFIRLLSSLDLPANLHIVPPRYIALSTFLASIPITNRVGVCFSIHCHEIASTIVELQVVPLRLLLNCRQSDLYLSGSLVSEHGIVCINHFPPSEIVKSSA